MRDGLGNDIVYIPISGLVEGQSTPVFSVFVDLPSTGKFTSESSTKARVMGREAGTMMYVDIAQEPFDLAGMVGSEVEFELYVEALYPIEGLERIPLSVSAGEAKPAGWSL